jgi:formiminotetrahydrofolate cyclodeaminase
LGRTLDRAAEVPLAIAEAACDVALLAAHAAERGDGEVRADAVTAALLAHGAARAAAHLVEVNLTSAVDDDRVRRVQDLVRTAGAAAEQAIAPAA